MHSRSATRILDTCLENGGLYIKFGQGLVSMNHVLPKEYLNTLKVLQDRALKRTEKETLENLFIFFCYFFLALLLLSMIICIVVFPELIHLSNIYNSNKVLKKKQK